jgi:hypothetical protein
VTPAAWVVAGGAPLRAGLVTSLVPRAFAADARVFHPATAADGSPVAWADVAGANGRVAHPAMDWVTITGEWRFHSADHQPGVWERAPEEGSLPGAEAATLAALLARFTTAQQWWYAVWEGFGTRGVGGAAGPATRLGCGPDQPAAGAPDVLMPSFAARLIASNGARTLTSLSKCTWTSSPASAHARISAAHLSSASSV